MRSDCGPRQSRASWAVRAAAVCAIGALVVVLAQRPSGAQETPPATGNPAPSVEAAKAEEPKGPAGPAEPSGTEEAEGPPETAQPAEAAKPEEAKQPAAEGAGEGPAGIEAPGPKEAEAKPVAGGAEAPAPAEEAKAGEPGGEELPPEEQREAVPAEEPSATEQKAVEREPEGARRARAAARRQEGISSSLQRLQKKPSLPRRASQRAALVNQVAQSSLVELGSLREELAGAKLELQRLRSVQDKIIGDRREVPPAIRSGKIPSIGASERWSALKQTSDDLQKSIDEIFGARVRLVAKLPQVEQDSKLAASLAKSLGTELDPALRRVVQDAAQNLAQRLSMVQELLEIYNKQADVATQAYVEASRYSEELSEAIVSARSRGLQARVPGRLSWTTITSLGPELARLGELPSAMAERYRAEGRLHGAGGWALRITGIVIVLAALTFLWTQLPRWVHKVAERQLNDDTPDAS